MTKAALLTLTTPLFLGCLAAPVSASLKPASLPADFAPLRELRETAALHTAVSDPFRPTVPESRPLIRLAHALLVRAVPEKESTITDSPEEVLLIFNEGVGQAHLALAVVDQSGHRVDKHDAKLDFTDRSHLRASIETLNPGRYMVRYRVLSADGHVVSGKYFFQMQNVKGDPDHEPNNPNKSH